jgi:pimeloyl-ACP methyl ester carboxylesterase
MALAALTALTLTVTVADLSPAVGDTAAQPAALTTKAGAAAAHVKTRARATEPRQVNAPVPTLTWTACNDGSGLQCADARVPLDYDQPTGATMRLHMTRLEADPLAGQTKIGTLFVNPGGPGGPSSQVPGIFAKLLGKNIHHRFDVVGIDPRGIGGAPIARCRIPEQAPPGLPRAFPMTSPEVKRVVVFNRYLRKSCRAGGSPIIDHMTTADTARDMDLIRQAVGDDKLTYYGISYGTYLGATYARMFPGRVRALITDGVLDPVAWSTGRHGAGTKLPFSTRLRSGHGAAEALLSAFAVCDHVGRHRCAFAGNATSKWKTMVARLRQGPVRFAGGRLYYASLVEGVLSSLYGRSAYRPMMRDLQTIWNHFPTTPARTKTAGPEVSAADAKALTQASKRLADRVQPFPYGSRVTSPRAATSTAPSTVRQPGYGPLFFPMFEGVACADTVNPTDPFAWQRAAVKSETTGQPWFGRLWTWASQACPRWPGSHADAYRGPWSIRTAYPVLIVGNSHDPATPISGARALHRAFKNSRLFSMNGWGHGALGTSRCVTRTFQAYLVHRDLPSAGLVCQPNKGLFPAR